MNIDFEKLPLKAKKKLGNLLKVLKNAEDKLYCVIQIDYNTGMIRFESLCLDNLFINLYTTTFTLTVEFRNPGERNNQFHWKNINHKIIKEIFNDPKGIILKKIL